MADEAALWGDPTTLCTLEELHAARAALQSYADVLRTPLLPSWPVGEARISLKLESLQTTGSFKIRGMRYKLHVSDVARLQGAGVVTLSAGNAGKAVAYLGQACGYNAKVFMPETAPDERKRMMEAMGATVVKVSLDPNHDPNPNPTPNPNPNPNLTPNPDPDPNPKQHNPTPTLPYP